MCRYISNKLVFTGTQVLDSLFLTLLYILTYSDSPCGTRTGSRNINIPAEDAIWLHLVETRAATPGRRVASPGFLGLQEARTRGSLRALTGSVPLSCDPPVNSWSRCPPPTPHTLQNFSV